MLCGRLVLSCLCICTVAETHACSRSITDEDWEILFRTNVLGYARCIKHALSHIRKNEPSDYIIENDQGQGIQVRSARGTPNVSRLRFAGWMVSVYSGWIVAAVAQL